MSAKNVNSPNESDLKTPAKPEETWAVVLVIDDQAMIQEAIRSAVASASDIELHECMDAQQATGMVTEIKPTVILQAVVMAGIDGLTLLKQFRANPDTRDVPIIVLATDENPQVKEQAFALGADDFMVKLPDRIELLARIRYHSKAFVRRLQRDAAYRALRDSQEQLIESNAVLISLNTRLETGYLDGSKMAFGPGGYIVLNLPESQKSVFRDLLFGFEEYANICGYAISFSFDSSITNRIVFKFTLPQDDERVSPDRVQKDLNDYMNVVMSGAPLTQLPLVLAPDRPRSLLLAMHNRINFLQNSHDIQRQMIEDYRKLLTDFVAKSVAASPAHNFILQAGPGSAANNFSPVNSPNPIQTFGDGLIDNRLDQSIHVADSFNERATQIDAVENLRQLLIKGNPPGLEDSAEVVKSLQRIVDELKHEARPDPTRIHRWLETAKYSLKALGLTKEVSDAAKVAWEAFKLTFM